MRKIWMIVVIAALLGACATAPKFDMAGVNTATTPSDAARVDSTRGTKVLWGGTIVHSKNLEQGTQLEVLAYPLDSRQRPITSREPLGRFIVEHPSYLETVDYAAGRLLTLIGTVTGTKQGKIDEASYTYPAVASEQLHLWSKSGEDSGPRLHFGVGVMFHN
jgi:outer membrane lipoprotein